MLSFACHVKCNSQLIGCALFFGPQSEGQGRAGWRMWAVTPADSQEVSELGWRTLENCLKFGKGSRPLLDVDVSLGQHCGFG